MNADCFAPLSLAALAEVINRQQTPAVVRLPANTRGQIGEFRAL